MPHVSEFEFKKMAAGAVEESVNLSISKVLDNIADKNTKATALREITLKIKLKPGEDREDVTVVYEVSEKLAGRRSVESELTLDKDVKGNNVAMEHTMDIPFPYPVKDEDKNPGNVSEFPAKKEAAK
jgi:hypothetical protein